MPVKILEPTHAENGAALARNNCPPLENGDRLTRAEFERRYDAMPHLKKAELLDGVVYMPSPVRQAAHSDPHSVVVGWLVVYRAATPGVLSGDNGSVRLDDDNMPQPDAYLFVDRSRGGQAIIDEDDYVAGAPELVAEVASSSVSYDLGVKLEVYRRHQAREYLVWRVLDGQVDWFTLVGDRFEPLAPGPDGILRSLVFPGLWLDASALLRGDLAAAFAALQRGIESADHAEFVKRLQERVAN
jgi:Uma2 family endonuclease